MDELEKRIFKSLLRTGATSHEALDMLRQASDDAKKALLEGNHDFINFLSKVQEDYGKKAVETCLHEYENNK